MKEVYRHLHVEGRDDWFLNPMTWGCGASVVVFLLLGWHVAAIVAGLCAIPANLNVEYESRTETINTTPNQ